MQCPNCRHVTDEADFQCSACGHAYDRPNLERLRQLEFLVHWLDEHGAHAALSTAAQRQLAALVAELKPSAIHATPRPLPAPASASDWPNLTSWSPAEDLTRARSALLYLSRWSTAAGLSQTRQDRLRAELSARVAALAKLPGTADLAPASEHDAVEYALKVFPSWALDPLEYILSLRLRATARQAKRPAPAPGPVAAPAPAASPAAPPPATSADALALTTAVLAELETWTPAAALSQLSEAALRALLSQRQSLHARARSTGSSPAAPPSEESMLLFARHWLTAWMSEANLSPDERSRLRAYLQSRLNGLNAGVPAALAAPPSAAALPVLTASAVAAAVPAPSAPVPPPAPAAPPLPPRPPINWGELWERGWRLVVSGALLRGLLYLGAFMIVASAMVLVVAFWRSFHPLLQIGFIAAVPLSFYGGGFVLRQRLKLPLAGSVFTGIGALLVAVDFAAVYQLGGLRAVLPADLYWLGASLLCAALYVFTSLRVRGEFFAYLALIGYLNVMAALVAVLPLPPFWLAASLAAASLGLVTLSALLQARPALWPDLVLPTRRLPQVIFPPVALFALILAGFVPGDQSLLQALTLAFVAAGYAGLALQTPARRHVHAAVWASALALAFSLPAAGVPASAWAATAALLAFGYREAGRWQARRWPADPAARAAMSSAWHHVGGLWLLAAILNGLWHLANANWINHNARLVAFMEPWTFSTSVWPPVLALALASGVLAAWAYEFRRPAYVFLGAGGLIVPVTAAALEPLLNLAVPWLFYWLMVVWAALSLAYLGLAALRPTAGRYGRWLVLWSQVFTALAAFVLVPRELILLVFFNGYAGSGGAGPWLVALGGVLAVYLASARLHHTGRHPALSMWVHWLGRHGQAIFWWPWALLVPFGLAITWAHSPLPWNWLGVAFAALALLYAGLGQGLARLKLAYRLPWHVAAYVLAALGIFIAGRIGVAFLSDGALALVRPPLMAALYLAVATLAALALVYRRSAETTVAGLLFIWPLQLSLDLSPLLPHAYSLVYAAVASLVYTPLGLRLKRRWPGLSLPLFVTGYGLAALAVIFSLVGRFGFMGANVPWIGVATPLLVLVLLVVSATRLPPKDFAWASVPVLALAFGQTLTLVGLPPAFHAAAWVAWAAAHLLAERGLTRAGHLSLASLAAYRVPLALGALALWAGGLVLTLPATVVALATGVVVEPVGVLAAQALGTVLVIAAARLYRSRWILYAEPVLAFSLSTLAVQAACAYWLDVTMTVPQFGLAWAGLAMAHLAAGALLDRSPVRYAHAPYAAGYALGGLALLWALPEQTTTLSVLGLGVLAALWSQLWVHTGRHRSFVDLLQFGSPDGAAWDPVARSAAETLFLFVAAYAVPFWVALALSVLGQSWAVQGLGLALLAPAYVGIARRLRGVRAHYTWPFYSAGYALTVIAALLAFDQPAVLVWVLAADAALYTISAVIFRQAAWLYPTNLLMPVIALLVLSLGQRLEPNWSAPVLMALAFVDIGAAQLFDWRGRQQRPALAPYALPFLAPGYLLSVLALMLGTPAFGAGQVTALFVYSAGVIFYAALAWLYRSTFLLYPAAWLAAVPYFLALDLLGLPGRFFGLACVPLLLAYLIVGRLAFHRQPLREWPLIDAALHPALPFYVAAYALSIAALLTTPSDLQPFAASAVAAVYCGSAVLFRRPAWLYPGLLSVHWALLSALALIDTSAPPAYISLPMHALTWLLALAGSIITLLSRRGAAAVPERKFAETLPLGVGWVLEQARPLMQSVWARPFFLFVAADSVLWQSVADGTHFTGLVVAGGHAALLGLLATLWLAPVLAYAALAVTALAVVYGVGLLGGAWPVVLACLAGLGFGLALLARLVSLLQRVDVLRLWIRPLDHVARALTIASAGLVLPWYAALTSAVTASFGFAGAHALMEAVRGRRYRLGYFAVALLLSAWCLELWAGDISQPQWYALPAGLYFSGVGYLERRLGRKQFAVLVEGLGLAVLLVTSFIQSLQGGAAGVPYFLLLIVEALLVVGWGALRRLKAPFFVGLLASVVNVLGQVVLLFTGGSTLIRWLIIGATGLLIVGLAIFVERQRERIIAATQAWREALEQWD